MVSSPLCECTMETSSYDTDPSIQCRTVLLDYFFHFNKFRSLLYIALELKYSTQYDSKTMVLLSF